MIQPDEALFAVPLAVLDVETTGLSAHGGDRVCEIAVVRIDPDGAETLVHSLVDPQRPISAGASAVNGLTDADVAGAPRFDAVAGAVLEALSGAALVAHNVPFDRSFLDAEMRRIGGPPASNPAVDTLALARAHFDFPSNALGIVARCLRVEKPAGRAHRAEADARTTLGVLRSMRPHLETRGLLTLADYVRASAGGPPGRTRYAAPVPPLIEAALASGGVVEIAYRGTARSLSRRIVRPLRVQGGYLIAFCELRRDERTFRLDRIERISPIDRPRA